jgi:hypothetical protein
MIKRKIGIILILVGISIPLVMLFLQTDGAIKFGKEKVIERELTQAERQQIKKQAEKKFKETGNEYYKSWMLFEIEGPMRYRVLYEGFTIRYKHCIGLGILLLFIGIGFFTFSFFPSKKA